MATGSNVSAPHLTFVVACHESTISADADETTIAFREF